MKELIIIKGKSAEDRMKLYPLNLKEFTEIVNKTIRMANIKNFDTTEYNILYINCYTEKTLYADLAKTVIKSNNPEYYKILDEVYIYIIWDIDERKYRIGIYDFSSAKKFNYTPIYSSKLKEIS